MGATTAAATVIAAGTEALRRAARSTAVGADVLVADATRLGACLDDLRRQRSWNLSHVPDLDGHVGALAQRLRTEADDLAALATAFEAADSGGWRGWLGSAVGASIVGAWVSEAAAPAAFVDVTDHVVTIRAVLDPGGWGVRRGDLDRIGSVLRARNGAQIDAIVAALTDDELRRWFVAMDEPWWRGGWSAEQRDELLRYLGERMHLDTWRRMARLTHHLEPSMAGVGGDLARTAAGPSEARLSTIAARGVLAARGPGDGSPYAFDDATQGLLGDCWLVGAMVALALKDPRSLERLIEPNRNGTFTVRFPDGHREVVSPDVPVRDDGGFRFVGYAGGGDGGTELWPLLLEKAVAQREGGWAAIEDGSAARGVELLSGRPGGWLPVADVSVADLARRSAAGQILILATIAAPTATPGDRSARGRWLRDVAPEPFRWGTDREHRLHPGHAFVVIDVDASVGTVSVINPWNPAWPPLVLSERDLLPSISGVFVNAADSEGSRP